VRGRSCCSGSFRAVLAPKHASKQALKTAQKNAKPKITPLWLRLAQMDSGGNALTESEPGPLVGAHSRYEMGIADRAQDAALANREAIQSGRATRRAMACM
jgi:hypothetical protein